MGSRIGFVILLMPFAWGCSGSPGGESTNHPDGGAEVAATGCEGVDTGAINSPTYADLNVTASGFAEHEGHAVLVVTRSNSSGVLGARSATVTGGGFAFRFPKGYQRSEDQELLWLIDADGDGLCNTDAGDHTGYLLVNAVDPGSNALDVLITDNHVRTTSRNDDICNPAVPFGEIMDINITGKGFEAHDGQRVHLLTRRTYNGAIFGSSEAVVTGGGFAFHFPKGYMRSTYQEILLFVDVDGDGVCVPGTDHTGYSATSAFDLAPVDEQVTDSHMSKTARNADVCVVMNGCQVAP
jgi:hypothetical protein